MPRSNKWSEIRKWRLKTRRRGNRLKRRLKLGLSYSRRSWRKTKRGWPLNKRWEEWSRRNWS